MLQPRFAANFAASMMGNSVCRNPAKSHLCPGDFPSGNERCYVVLQDWQSVKTCKKNEPAIMNFRKLLEHNDLGKVMCFAAKTGTQIAVQSVAAMSGK